ncbi:FMN-dependent NADH-azoreductase [Nannocystis radixulma]|uniref:FMN dependent NADH:quinone oxidoreductase n=1 Tax=Nannocystis radixulma TaxID=2995305 RepID=A0ABT5BHU8_9BACT|nr:NAD(P)H-dependent oxidoreductase [Nannocystis radixulma]MDC0672546.1 NAD(P)H-dependent oxidoreductase [Nannocystis radixulma]
MKTLLRIDASARQRGSCSRQLADCFQARWAARHPGGRVVVRDLAQSPVPHLDGATMAVFCGIPAPAEAAPPAGVALSDALIAELRAADHLLLACPMYNLGLPSPLKAYVDHVVRRGHTFVVEDGRFVGLLGHTSATLVATRGAIASPTLADDFQIPYLRALLAFIGIDRVEVIAADGMAQEEAVRAQRLARAQAQIDRLFTPAPAEPARRERDTLHAGNSA